MGARERDMGMCGTKKLEGVGLATGLPLAIVCKRHPSRAKLLYWGTLIVWSDQGSTVYPL